MLKNISGLPVLGAGVGLRRQHFDEIVERRPPVRWFEVIPENFIGQGGRISCALERIAEQYRLVAHGVGLSIGSADPLDFAHLGRVKRFCDQVESPWFSDHLCAAMVEHMNLNEMQPLPFNETTVRHVVSRAKVVQDILERPFLLENVAFYKASSASQLSEAEFISRVLEGADCGLLLDVSNVILNSKNHGFDSVEFLGSIPLRRVVQLHLAGYEEYGDFLLDTHAKPVSDETWALYREVIRRIGPSSVLVEWDAEIPALNRLLQEAEMAQSVMDEIERAQSQERGVPERPTEVGSSAPKA